MVRNPNVNKAFVYKIADVAPPVPLPGVLPLSELDRKGGFIHLSDAKQVRGIPRSAGRRSSAYSNYMKDSNNSIAVLQRRRRALDIEGFSHKGYGSEVA